MKIKILGKGCPKCTQLEENAKKAVEDAGIQKCKIQKVTDLNDIMEYNVMMTPALVVDGKVKSTGKVLSSDEIVKIIT